MLRSGRLSEISGFEKDLVTQTAVQILEKKLGSQGELSAKNIWINGISVEILEEFEGYNPADGDVIVVDLKQKTNSTKEIIDGYL